MPGEPWNAQTINALANGYWAPFALHAAVRSKVTVQLALGPASAAELAKALELSPRGLGMLLTVLTTLGLLAKDGDIYSLSPDAAPFLTPGSPGDMSNIINHIAYIAPDWTKLHECVHSGKPVAEEWTDEERSHFYFGMRDIARQQACGLSGRLALEPGRRLLDLGGGPGVYGYTFAQEAPGLKVTVFDLPGSEDSFREEAGRFENSSNVTRINGDYKKDPVGGPYDIVWISQVLHGEGPDVCQLMLNKAAEALTPGGVLWVQEFIVDYEGKGHPFAALFSLNMLVQTKAGQSYSQQEIARFMTQAGLVEPEFVGTTMPGAPSALMKAVKPA